MSALPKIVGYQVQDEKGNNWADRPSFLILSEQTALGDMAQARMRQFGIWLMIAIFEGDIEEPEYEVGYTPITQAHVSELVSAASPLSELLFDHYPPGEIHALEVDGGDVTRLKLALAPFLAVPSTEGKKVRINAPGMTFGKEGLASWDEAAQKWEVAFSPPWSGWYTEKELDFI
jgi:hypothetical protein